MASQMYQRRRDSRLGEMPGPVESLRTQMPQGGPVGMQLALILHLIAELPVAQQHYQKLVSLFLHTNITWMVQLHSAHDDNRV